MYRKIKVEHLAISLDIFESNWIKVRGDHSFQN